MELDRLLAAVRRFWWIVASVALLGAFVGLLAEASRPERFLATATIQTAPDRNVFGSETVLNRLVINEIATVGSDPLRDAVVASLADAGVAVDPSRDLSVRQVLDTELIQVTVAAPSGPAAVEAANLWAQSYVDLVSERDRSELLARVEEVNAELEEARDTRLALEAAVSESIFVRANGQFSTYTEAILRQPAVWEEIERTNQEIALLTRERTEARRAFSNVLDSEVVAIAAGEPVAVKPGNGLGPVHGLIIGLALAVSAVSLTSHGRASFSMINEITASAWPTKLRLVKRRISLPQQRERDALHITALGTRVLTHLPATDSPIISFHGADPRRTQDLKQALADDLRDRGYSIAFLQDLWASRDVRSVEDLFDSAAESESLVFADLGEVQSRSYGGRVMTVIAVGEHLDEEEIVARRIADSVENSNAVLTVLAR